MQAKSECLYRCSIKDKQESVINLVRLLREVTAHSGPLYPELLEACRRQATLAKLNLPAEGIVPMSLNTLKRTSSDCLGEDGWQKIDALRIAVLRSTPKARMHLTPLAAARQHAAKADARNDDQFQTRAVLYRAYNSALTLAQEFSDDKPERLEKIRRLQALYADIFDLRLAKET